MLGLGPGLRLRQYLLSTSQASLLRLPAAAQEAEKGSPFDS